jgi:hypothetical protein
MRNVWFAWQKKCKAKVFFVRKKVPRHEGVWRDGGITPRISTMDGSAWSASHAGRFTSREGAPRYPLDRMMGGPHSQVCTRWQIEKNFSDGARNRSQFVQPVAQSHYSLIYRGSLKETRMITKHWFETLIDMARLCDEGVRVNIIILKWILMEQTQEMWTAEHLRTDPLKQWTNLSVEYLSTLKKDPISHSWLWAGWPGFNSRQGKWLDFFLFITAMSQPVLGPTEPPIQGVPRDLIPGIKRPWCEADHSPPPSAEVKNDWSYTPFPHHVFMAWW